MNNRFRPPALTNTLMEACTMTVRRYPTLEIGTPTWDPSAPVEVISESVPAVRVTMTVEDWDEIFEVYQAHRGCASQSPAVRDAWQQYRMLCELTVRSRS